MAARHVAIDCRVVSPVFPGIGRATLESARALAELGPCRLSLLVASPNPAPAVVRLARHRDVDIVPIAASPRDSADQWLLPLILRRLRPDVYHATYYALPVLTPGRVVTTIYDLIPRLFPGYWPNPAARALINAWTEFAIRRGVRVITCSQSTADDVVTAVAPASAKVRVVPLGVGDPTFGVGIGASRSRCEPYLLYVGSNKPHKNLPRLVAAFKQVATVGPGRLVVAGAWDHRYPEAKELAQDSSLQGRVVFESGPTDARLAELYAGATGFIFPSLYEGFGLPVLEAMAAGIPVATTGRGSLGEVAGDAALLFDPDDTAALAAAMHSLFNDAGLRARLSDLGRARAALFTWQRTAESTMAVYDEAASLRQ